MLTFAKRSLGKRVVGTQNMQPTHYSYKYLIYTYVIYTYIYIYNYDVRKMGQPLNK